MEVELSGQDPLRADTFVVIIYTIHIENRFKNVLLNFTCDKYYLRSTTKEERHFS